MSRTRRRIMAGAAIAMLALGAVQIAHAIGYPPRCSSTGLGLRPNGPAETAGTIRTAWVLTNLSRAACYLDGHPVLRLYGTLGRPFAFVQRSPPASGPVGLGPGGVATFFTSYRIAPSGKRCPTSGVMGVDLPLGRGTLAIPAVMHLCGALWVSGFVRGIRAP